MDKDLLRIVIIAVGAVVVLAMILWSLFSNGSKRTRINFYDDRDPLENIDPGLVVNTDDDDFDIVPLNTADDSPPVTTRLNSEYMQEAQHNSAKVKEKVQVEDVIESKELPALLQLSIVAKSESGFAGAQLLDAFARVGLIYGSVKVFERLDDLNQVDYAVASMAQPGIFPGDNWDEYLCPGVTFFMQPNEVANAAEVFDEMIATIGQLSGLLKGDVLDQNQELLTAEVLEQIKASLN